MKKWMISGLISAVTLALAAAGVPPADAPLPREAKTAEDAARQEKARLERNKLAEKGGVNVYFLGDSITAGWRYSKAKTIWNANFSAMKPGNFGIGGDRTMNVLWRLDNGDLPDGCRPRVFVLMIGTNNLKMHTDDQIVSGIEKIVSVLRSRRPEAAIVLHGILPRGGRDSVYRKRIALINETIARLADDKKVFFLDFGPDLLDADGEFKEGVVKKDQLHLLPGGYAIWAEKLSPLLKKLVGPDPAGEGGK